MYSYRIEQAIKAATLLHKNQEHLSRRPIPFISHLASVAWIVRDYTEDENTLVAAWLHDTLEDTDYTTEELEHDFGREVRELVEAITEPKDQNGQKPSLTKRKTAYLEQLKEAPESALIVFAADKIHSLRTVVEQYFNNHQGFLKDFPVALTETAIFYQNIANLLNRRSSNDIIAEFNHVYTEYKNFLAYVEKEQPPSTR